MCPTRHPAMEGLGLCVSHCTTRAGASLAAESYFDKADSTGQLVMIACVQNTWFMLCLFEEHDLLSFYLLLIDQAPCFCFPIVVMYRMRIQCIPLARCSSMIASNLLLVDEMMRAGKTSLKQSAQQQMDE
jgi:hypothetical protein